MYDSRSADGASQKRNFIGPVSWLLGRQLIAGLKWIAVYALYGEKLDARDWMRAEIADHSGSEHPPDVFWFDYLADSGDGQKAVYNIAYLCQGDLWLLGDAAVPGENKIAVRQQDSSSRLPRGEFLFVGGDTAYHIADYSTLSERFRKPFNWAYEDRFGASKDQGQQRPIYGIPGNHDYYDALDGFNRQFCKPVVIPDACVGQSADDFVPQLELSGFVRRQEASYVALKLPFDWQFWGLDTQAGTMDKRQQAYFLSTCVEPEAGDGSVRLPAKLIVATPEPTTRFGQCCEGSAEIVNTFDKLGLEQPFLDEGKLAQGKCRLDLSGDIHHYARYWGPAEPDASTPERDNYASVIAGGGGAFLHASHTDIGDVPMTRVYPSREESHNTITANLLRPWNIFNGGYIWLAGGLVALVAYFAATVPDSTWSLLHALGLDTAQPCAGSASCAGTAFGRSQAALDVENITDGVYASRHLALAYALAVLALIAFWSRRIKSNPRPLVEASRAKWAGIRVLFIAIFLLTVAPMALLIVRTVSGVPHPFMASMLVLLFVMVSVACLVCARRLSDLLLMRKKFLEREQERETSGRSYGYRGQQLSWSDEVLPAAALVAASMVSACFAFWRYGIYPMSVVFTDIVVALVLTATVAGLVGLAIGVGGRLNRGTAKWRFVAIGVWHAALQLSLPFIMLMYSGWITMVLVVIAVTAATPVLAGRFHYQNGEFTHQQQTKMAWWLFAAWFGLGAAAILAVVLAGVDQPMPVTWPRTVAAFFIGLILSCVWFGWYLAVSLGFNGHNNEAGGGARSDRYRHFIRFKLTRDSLTGYVIGVDEPVEDFNGNPTFRLVDVFTLSASDTTRPS